ncbi:MAG: hypothetical protein QOK44_200 [Betaproteobacteria bacterium]|nr:hypothetical protein [Betaproteobacteria bacterium]
MRRTLLLTSIVVMLAGCAAHSPMILKTTTDVTPVAQQYPAHSNPVLIVEGPLPADIEYEVIASVDVGRVWYTGADGILVLMAQRARALGADAVINVKRWRQPSGFAWAAPHGQGQAVKIRKNDKAIDLSSLGKMI